MIDENTKEANRDLSERIVIGIGSSAGGLEAIRELVTNLPKDMLVSYVIVQHMSPKHKSLLTELLQRETDLVVAEVEDPVTPQPNVIYVTPPRADVIMQDGQLCLTDPNPNAGAPKPSVDRFLISLANEVGARAVGVVLSGTGSDGAYGVQAIREAGGITIAQDDSSAKYDGMPTAAIETGCVDLVLRPSDIGIHLSKILASKRDFAAFRRDNLQQTPITDLLQILLAAKRVDFREYKQTTVQRRIERRMVAIGLESQDEYTAHCRQNPGEVDALFKDLLISVTRFFRDKGEFESLEALLPGLIDEPRIGPFRVWVAGCATGEEAYSIAMLLAEKFKDKGGALADHVQIFATDIDVVALRQARSGIYPAIALNDVPEHLAEKYFVRHGDGIRVIDSLRGAILFSEHNLCQDPPFQNIDLICCRNVLIYFGQSLQQRALARFSYSMKDSSVLVLGTAESIGGSESQFLPIDKSSHIFRHRQFRRGSSADILLGVNDRLGGRPSSVRPHTVKDPAKPSSDRHMFEALAQSLGQNSLLVTDGFEIAQVFGDVSNYIRLDDSTTLKLQLSLLRSPLREEARSLIAMAIKKGVQRTGMTHRLAPDDPFTVQLEVYPINAKPINEFAALLVFRKQVDLVPEVQVPVVIEDGSEMASERIRSLEADLATTREALQQTIEELETSNEELQALNEELQSTNEELQSTNEELETSNEELQSTNEELVTVNEELQVNSSILNERTNELVSVLKKTPSALLVLDSALQIQQATEVAIALFALPKPVGRPHVSQCALPEGFPALAPICHEVMKLGEKQSREFQSASSIYRMDCSPHVDEHRRIRGVTLLFSEFPKLSTREIAQSDAVH